MISDLCLTTDHPLISSVRDPRTFQATGSSLASARWAASFRSRTRLGMSPSAALRHVSVSCRLHADSGPPPLVWRGEIRRSGCRAQGDRLHAGASLGRGSIAQGRVQALPMGLSQSLRISRETGDLARSSTWAALVWLVWKAASAGPFNGHFQTLRQARRNLCAQPTALRAIAGSSGGAYLFILSTSAAAQPGP